MNAYEALLKHHRMGSEISGIVIARDEPDYSRGWVRGRLTLQTETAYPAVLPYDFLVDERSSFSPAIIPPIGAQVRAVVFNFVNDTLILSAKPKDFLETTINRWRQYYSYIETLAVGSTIRGRVGRSRPFGLFVDMGGPFVGLVEIGPSPFNGCVALPYHRADWPKEGDEIACSIGYFRFCNKQIGLGWVPASGA